MKEKVILETLLKDERVIKALKFIEDDNDNAINEQIDLAMIEAPTTFEDRKADYLVDVFNKYNLDNVHKDEIKNAIGILKGTDNGTILIEAHLDTVFPFGSTGDKRPEIDENGFIHLPGITDDNRGIEVFLSCLRAIKHAGIINRKNIMFAGTAREEGVGSIAGMKKIVEDYPEIDGSISVDGDYFTGIIHKGIGLLTKKYNIRGVSGHAWTRFSKDPQAVHALSIALGKIAEMEVSLKDPRSSYAITNVHGGTYEAMHAICNEMYFIINYRSEDTDELLRMDKYIKDCVEYGIEKEESRCNAKDILSYEVETLCDIPGGSVSKDSKIVKAYDAVIRYMGEEPTYEEGICCNANAMLSVGKPAVCMGAGSGVPTYIHSLNEQFNVRNADKMTKAALLLLLLLSGTDISPSIFE